MSSLVILALALMASQIQNAQAVRPASLTALDVPYTQNFDTLPASGSATWTNNSTIPEWFHARTGTGTTIVANDGSSNAGNLYSYGTGTGTSTDRALGSLGSGNAAIGNLFWGVRLANDTGSTITSLDVSYTGEQWRNSAAAAQTVAFSYLVGSPTVTGSLAEFQSPGVAVPALDFTSPITGGAAGALNGNLAANRVTLSFSITGLSIPDGTEVMLRWSDPDHTGADHGLSVDDFSVTPAPSAISISVAATRSNRGVLVSWRTAAQVDTLAFNVYRQVEGKRVKLNRSVIPARSSISAATYSYLDRRAPRAASLRYWLQVVDVDGSRRWWGPVHVRATRRT
jgi:hypothetical protein